MPKHQSHHDDQLISNLDTFMDPDTQAGHRRGTMTLQHTQTVIVTAL